MFRKDDRVHMDIWSIASGAVHNFVEFGMQTCDIVQNHVIEFATRVTQVGVGHVVWDIDSDDTRSDKLGVAIKETAGFDFFLKIAITMNA